MKRFIAFIFAAAMLLTAFTGCSKEDNSASKGEPNRYADVYDSFIQYFPPFDYPTEDGLPMVKTTGAVSLKDSFENDERFRAMLEGFSAEPDFQKRCEITEKILTALCGAEEISDEPDPFSKRKLEILRKFWSSDRESAEEKIPDLKSEEEFYKSIYVSRLEHSYELLVSRYCLSLICSLAYNDLSYVKKYTDDNGNEYPYMGYFNKLLHYGIELGKMSEKEFSDSVTALTVYAFMIDKSMQMPADFYAYVLKQSKNADEDSTEQKCLELTEQAFRTTREAIYLIDGANISFADYNDNFLSGSGSSLLAGGNVENTFKSKGGGIFMVGGSCDDIYIIAGDGESTIYDCGGRNTIDLWDKSDIYAVGFSEDDLKNDVKLCYGGGFVIIKDFLSDSSVKYDVLIKGEKIVCDSPENPLSDIHEPGYVPEASAAPPR